MFQLRGLVPWLRSCQFPHFVVSVLSLALLKGTRNGLERNLNILTLLFSQKLNITLLIDAVSDTKILRQEMFMNGE